MSILHNDVAGAIQAQYRATAAHERLVRDLTTSASVSGSAFNLWCRATCWLHGLTARCLAPVLARAITIAPAVLVQARDYDRAGGAGAGAARGGHPEDR
jgi:hypothetical protein